MDEASFRRVIAEHLLPMLSGTSLGRTHRTGRPHTLVAYQNPIALLMSPSRSAEYRVQLLRSQPFSPAEKTLVAYFVEELSRIAAHVDEVYFHDMMVNLPRRVISRLLPGNRGRKTFERAIQYLEVLASQTYEGRPVVVALGMTGSMGHGAVSLDDLWNEDFSRVLSNGVDSMYVCGSDGRVFSVAYLESALSIGFAPMRLGAIADWCKTRQRVAVVLNRNGEVLIFKDQKLQFAKRRGAWRYYAHDSIVRRLGVGNAELRKSVYESCLDISFARTGGCIAVLSAKSVKSLSKYLAEVDDISNRAITRTKLLADTVRKPFQKLDRKLRQELLSLDGATIIDHTGKLLTAGAIIRVGGGSEGGGRRAAAKQLSRIGVAVKISADGPITGFRQRKMTFQS